MKETTITIKVGNDDTATAVHVVDRQVPSEPTDQRIRDEALEDAARRLEEYLRSNAPHRGVTPTDMIDELRGMKSRGRRSFRVTASSVGGA